MLLLILDSFFPTESYVEEERKYLISDSRACWMAHAVALSKKRERERKKSHFFFVPSKIKESHVRFLSLTACLYLLNLTTLLFLYRSGQENVNLLCGECDASRANPYKGMTGDCSGASFYFLPRAFLSSGKQRIWVLRARRGHRERTRSPACCINWEMEAYRVHLCGFIYGHDTTVPLSGFVYGHDTTLRGHASIHDRISSSLGLFLNHRL